MSSLSLYFNLLHLQILWKTQMCELRKGESCSRFACKLPVLCSTRSRSPTLTSCDFFLHPNKNYNFNPAYNTENSYEGGIDGIYFGMMNLITIPCQTIGVFKLEMVAILVFVHGVPEKWQVSKCRFPIAVQPFILDFHTNV